MKYVRVQDGIVHECFDEKPIFHEDLMKTIFEAPDEVRNHWLYDGSKFSPPPPEPKEGV